MPDVKQLIKKNSTNKIILAYHSHRLKNLMMEYQKFLSDLNCGYELAKYMFNQVQELENKMDKSIIAINKLDNKSFQLFREGYCPSWRFN